MKTTRRQLSAENGAPGRGDSAEAPVRVLLVGDVRLYREAIAGAIAGVDGVELAGSAPHDVAAMAAGVFEPGVVVVDAGSVSVPHGMRTLAAALPEASIVAIGVPDDEAAVVALLEAGVAGYVTADQPFADLITAVEAAANGELQCSPRLAAVLAKRVAALATSGPRASGGDTLTPRQREIATLIAEGLSNKQIAHRLSIERATVKNHVHSILLKLAVTRRDQVGSRLHL
jgi:DNA-binding NarL/FixJ family response regulator